LTKITNHNLEEMLVLINFVIPVEKDIPLLAALTFLAHLVISEHSEIAGYSAEMGSLRTRAARPVGSSSGFFTVQWRLKLGKNREGQDPRGMNPDYSP